MDAQIQSMIEFTRKHPANPVTHEPLIVAKDSSYPDQEGDEAWNLLVPLSAAGHYMYVKTYICPDTNVSKQAIAVAQITNIVEEAKGRLKFTPPHVGSEAWKLIKGARFVPRLLEYFSSDSNEMLYRAIKEDNVEISSPTKLYDTANPEWQANSGYIELIQQRLSVDGEMYHTVLIKSAKSKGNLMKPPVPKCFAILHEEYTLIAEFLHWAVNAYTLSLDGESDLEKERVKCINKSVQSALRKRKQQQEERQACGKKSKPKNAETTPSCGKQRALPKPSLKIKGSTTIAGHKTPLPIAVKRASGGGMQAAGFTQSFSSPSTPTFTIGGAMQSDIDFQNTQRYNYEIDEIED